MPTDDDAREEVIFPVPVAPTAGRFTPTPYSFEFTGEDGLRLAITSPFGFVRVAVHFRMHRPGASTHASRYVAIGSPTDYVTATSEFDIGEGFLLNCVVSVAEGTNYAGLQYVRLQVIRGRGAAATVLGTIVQGYIQAGQDLAWPGAPLTLSTEGNGALRTFGGLQPAAGAEFTTVVPVGALWQLLSISMDFITSAAAGQRTPILAWDVGGIDMWRSMVQASMGPSSGTYLCWAVGLPFETNFETFHRIMGLPTPYWIGGGTTIETLTGGLAAGDQYSSIRYRVKEWLEVN